MIDVRITRLERLDVGDTFHWHVPASTLTWPLMRVAHISADGDVWVERADGYGQQATAFGAATVRQVQA